MGKYSVNDSDYVHINSDGSEVTLDGHFTIQNLENIIILMKSYQDDISEEDEE